MDKAYIKPYSLQAIEGCRQAYMALKAERDALQARIDEARDEAANGIEFSMRGGRGGYAKRLCRIIEILEANDGKRKR